MKAQHAGFGGALILGLAVASSFPLEAQGSLAPGDQRIEGMEWNIRNLRPSGMPVIPMFDGWLDQGDGTADLCFGYFNLNLVQTLDIPIGPDNFVEPAEFNGQQPTHFREVPRGDRRYFCVWSVNVPIGSDEVVWTLGHNFRHYSVPGHTNAPEYVLENFYQPSRDNIAPVLQFVEPQGPAGTGRGASSATTAGPARTRVGETLAVTLSVTEPEGVREGDPAEFQVLWHKFSGPGGITFVLPPAPEPAEPAPADTTAQAGGGGGRGGGGGNNDNLVFPSGASQTLPEGATSTTLSMIFDAPGDYVVLTQGLGGDFGGQCCWTTAYLRITVAP